MKRTKMKTAIAGVLVGMGVLMTGCSHLSVAHGNRSDLAKLRGIATSVNSALWARYVGESGSAVYVEYGTMVHPAGLITNKPKYTIYRFDKDEMTPEMKELIWWQKKRSN
ncbi:hypothetical protein BVX99_00870 [bacterium F16]|nr:hypothetical protein BVX99_00870 [bacterium F16]